MPVVCNEEKGRRLHHFDHKSSVESASRPPYPISINSTEEIQVEQAQKFV